jgi:hypothetical protein
MSEGNEDKYGKDVGQMDAFNLAVALIFEYFLHQFPIKQEVPYEFFVKQKVGSITEICQKEERIGINTFRAGETYIKNSNIPPRIYFAEIVEWLRLEGFLHEFAKKGYTPEFQLTSKRPFRKELSGWDRRDSRRF